MSKMKSEKKVSTLSFISIAAFAFAIVSCKATADGFGTYVFNSWETGLISFGIQALLLIFNLKLPEYISLIGRNTLERTGNKKIACIYQGVMIVFYMAALGASSFFSFVYICNESVYNHKCGYVDDNTIVSSAYRKYLNETEDYICEGLKMTQLMASELLGELQDKYPVKTTGDNVTQAELESIFNTAQVNYDLAKEVYDRAKTEADNAYEEAEGYAKSRYGTQYHNKQAEWEELYKVALKKYDDLKDVENTRFKDFQMAIKTLDEAKAKLNNYQESEASIISNFLLEMLKLDPDPAVLKNDISKLNDVIVKLDDIVNIVTDYAELVKDTQSLKIVVEDYITFQEALNDKEGIQSLSGQEMNGIVIPDPQKESFDKDYENWKQVWSDKLDNLEVILQKLPDYSDSDRRMLTDSVVNVDVLRNFKPDDKMDAIDNLRRNKISDINAIERAVSLLSGKYTFNARFAFGLALFLDMASLLAGLFLYGIRKKKSKQ